jgi:hypothetical protein
VQRWERELGLPIRRPRGKPRGPVIAFRRELDQWLQSAPTAEHQMAESQMGERQPEQESPPSWICQKPRDVEHVAASPAIYNVWFGLRCPEHFGNERVRHHIYSH